MKVMCVLLFSSQHRIKYMSIYGIIASLTEKDLLTKQKKKKNFPNRLIFLLPSDSFTHSKYFLYLSYVRVNCGG